GFSGTIFATLPTIDLAKIMLEDCAEVNAEDTRHENERRMRIGQEPREPLYTIDDVKRAVKLFSPVEYGTEKQLSPDLGAVCRGAGHILGSAVIELYATEGGKRAKIVFSGDLGQGNTPIVDDPFVIDGADYALIESTYGNRGHEDPSTREEALYKVIRDAY